jgi:ribosomal protein S18 acetylase RimI-like enzyme
VTCPPRLVGHRRAIIQIDLGQLIYNLPMSLFKTSLSLFDGNLNQFHTKLPTFIHIRSAFKDEWYNFIVPQVPPKEFDWKHAESLRQEEIAAGYQPSYYLEDSLKDDYHQTFLDKGFDLIGDDTYVVLDLTTTFSQSDHDFKNLSKADLISYKEAAASCFPDWPNAKEFSQLCYDLSMRAESDMLYHNAVYKEASQIASFGSLIASKKLKLAYLHNVATAPEFRRKGFFTKLNFHLCHLAQHHGAKQIFTIVEEGSASYHGYLKLGFKHTDQFHLYYQS